MSGVNNGPLTKSTSGTAGVRPAKPVIWFLDTSALVTMAVRNWRHKMTIPRDSGQWLKSSRSQANADCVEVQLGAAVGVRDTKDRDGGQLALPVSAWEAFITQL